MGVATDVGVGVAAGPDTPELVGVGVPPGAAVGVAVGAVVAVGVGSSAWPQARMNARRGMRNADIREYRGWCRLMLFMGCFLSLGAILDPYMDTYTFL